MKKSSKESVRLVDGDEPVVREVLSAAIVRMSAAAEKLAKLGINERAIIVLLHDAVPSRFISGRQTKPSREDIRVVLSTMRELAKRYCR